MKWNDIKRLRAPQRGSLDMIEKYLNNDIKESCLIHMPTGSGKSGVITLCSLLQFSDCVLIVTPRIAITDQIEREIRGEFNKTLKDVTKDSTLNINPGNRIVRRIDDKFTIDDNINYNNTIFISTVQKIDWLRKNRSEKKNNKIYNTLRKKVKLVIFDEGHYEPAYSWSVTIREFKTKKILFTATPFRNDLKPFDISPEYIYPYKYIDGVKDKYLRKIKFIQFSSTKDDSIFLKKIINKYVDIFETPGSDDNPKIIIRCSHRNTIRRLARNIHENYPEYSYIGIHEEFKNDDKDNLNLEKNVPDDIKTRPEIIWLHQHKLTEGIDDNNFRILAIYDTFRNERALIQQIGRIMRQSEKVDHTSYVIEFSDGKHEKMWKKFLLFDSKLDDSSFEPISEKVLKEFYKIGNDYEYLIDGFKSKFDFNKNKIPEEILLPLKANIIQKNNFSVSKFKDFLKEKYEKNDKPFIPQSRNIAGYNTFIFISLNLSYFPHFPEEYSINLTNDVVFFFEYKDSLIYYDSSGYVPLNEKKAGLGKAKNVETLRKIFYNDPKKSVLINSISLHNSNLGTNSITSHQYSAKSIDKTVSFLDDNAQIVTTAYGKEKVIVQEEFEEAEKVVTKDVTKIISKYVGFGKGRISQRSDWCNLHEYVEWVTELMELIDSDTITPLNTFNRYSKIANEVKNTNPENILIDLTEIEDDFKPVFKDETEENSNGIEERISFDELNYNIETKIVEKKSEKKQSFSFDLKVNDSISCKAYLSYSYKTGTYKIRCDSLDQFFEPRQNSLYSTITEFLNKQQSFKIIPGEKNVIYAYGQFYKVFQTYGDEFQKEKYFLNPIIIGIPELATVVSEKGQRRKRKSSDPVLNNWNKNTIFRLIVDLGNNTTLSDYIKKPDIVVVDDPNKEIADIILGYKGKNGGLSKVVFIHAKCSDDKSYSASALQEVCGQATKNIRYLNMFNTVEPPNINLWDKKWNWGGMSVSPRIRLPKNKSSDEVWSDLKGIIHNPTSEKEVWLVLGKTLKREEFLVELGKATNEAIQADLLLHSTFQNVGTVNAKLRVFCSP